MLCVARRLSRRALDVFFLGTATLDPFSAGVRSQGLLAHMGRIYKRETGSGGRVDCRRFSAVLPILQSEIGQGGPPLVVGMRRTLAFLGRQQVTADRAETGTGIVAQDP